MNELTKDNLIGSSTINMFNNNDLSMGIGIINKTRPFDDILKEESLDDSNMITLSDVRLSKKIKVLPDDILLTVLVRNFNTPNFS